MRITNADYSPLDVLSELLSYTRCSNVDTEDFFQDEHASHDWLTARWADKLDVVLNSFRRLGTDVYEQQHIRDYGVDVRLTFDHKSEHHKVGFQLKSNNEAVADSRPNRTGESMVAVLKRQAFEAAQRSGVTDWWIVLAFDRVKHAKKVQAINAELLSGTTLPIRITVVDPRKAMAFLSMSDQKIDAICTLLLCADDEVLKSAQSEVRNMGSFARKFVLSHIGDALNGERQISQDDIWSWNTVGDFDDEKAIEEIRDLESDGFLIVDDANAGYTVEPGAYPGLCALYFEGRVRHELNPKAAAEFMERLVDD
ncbi:hypothetical protein GCT19_09505 [Paraburkholderia sp. CNPSo 3155]|uniref:XopAX family type III secretion system effector n=1 Tax=Paraburkholderia atlantica TaxID=2654982 RepID=UPI00128D137A|nr:XopAX family type III secretion system effector [Paraburkholderia atlantica]MPW05879.1 hypothetical protein [Paraburkholderia atlantica]